MRYLIALVTSIVLVVMIWPYVRQFAPSKPRPDGKPKPPSKGELIYLAVLTTVVLSFTISTLLWVFGK
jgi:hypothetical protein